MTDEVLKLEVAWGSRIAAAEAGYDDLTLGHLSARSADGRNLLIKRQGVALEELDPDQIERVALEEHDAADRRPVPFELPLHTAIYRARTDVGAVLHGHPPHGTALGATDGSLAILGQDALLFGQDGVARYDGPPELIATPALGDAVAVALGAGRALLLRNHGTVIVGPDVRWAVLAAVALERAIALQCLAGSLGTPRPVDGDWARTRSSLRFDERNVAAYWDGWLRRLRRAGHDLPHTPTTDRRGRRSTTRRRTGPDSRPSDHKQQGE